MVDRKFTIGDLVRIKSYGLPIMSKYFSMMYLLKRPKNFICPCKVSQDIICKITNFIDKETVLLSFEVNNTKKSTIASVLEIVKCKMEN